jgi:hypothetical protein
MIGILSIRKRITSHTKTIIFNSIVAEKRAPLGENKKEKAGLQLMCYLYR